MNNTSTDAMKADLSEAGSHFKQAAVAAGDAVKGMVGAASDEAKLGKATLKAELADGAIASMNAAGNFGDAAGEQIDALMDKGRDLVDSASELIRERPLAAFGMAFAAGWIISKLGRSDK